MNRDGKLDLVVLENPNNTPTLKIYISTGTYFLPPVGRTLEGLIYLTEELAQANLPFPAKIFNDADGDGYPDLYVFDGSKVRIFGWEPSTLNFHLITQLDSNSFWNALDINGDGRGCWRSF